MSILGPLLHGPLQLAASIVGTTARQVDADQQASEKAARKFKTDRAELTAQRHEDVASNDATADRDPDGQGDWGASQSPEGHGQPDDTPPASNLETWELRGARLDLKA